MIYSTPKILTHQYYLQITNFQAGYFNQLYMLIIGIAGGSGCGKTTVVREIIKRLPKNSVSVIPQDAYYWDNGHLTPEEKLKINFDHPNSIEWDLLVRHIDSLRKGESIEMPVYSYISCARLQETVKIEPRQVIIIEGILIYSDKELSKRFDIKIYVDAESDDRLMRIIRRDTVERGRDPMQVLEHYSRWVKPMHLQFIEPTKRIADIIVPQGGENKVAIEILASRIKMKLDSGD
jgi:uridine kinase